MKLGKKLLALGLGAMMVIGAAGCGSDASQQDTGEAADTGSAAAVETAVSEESAAGETADGPMTKYAETIDLHFARSTDETVDKVLEARPEETLEDNFWLDTYRDELGINVIYDWIVKGGDEYTQKVNVTIANGELPDVMYVNKTQVQQMQEAGLLMDMTDAQWDGILSANLSSVFYCCREAIPYMVSRHSGRIINISSMWGSAGASCEAAYSATKAGVDGLTKALAKELAPSGIPVNAIALGVIDTRMNAQLSSKEREALCQEIPAGRFGTPEEAAELIYQTALSPSYLTGQIIRMDGGFL